jgi:deoxyribonuclease-4
MIKVNYNIGSHVSFNGKLSDSFRYAINFGMYSLQVFLGNPYNLKRAKITQEDLEECKKLKERYPLFVFSHFPYVANLCGSIKSLAWKGDEITDNKTLTVIESIEHELKIMEFFKGGVVIHPGSFKDSIKGLSAIAETLKKINFKKESFLLLENSAGQGTSLCTTLEQIKKLLIHDNIKVCIDTCHLYAYGDYNLSLVEEVERFFVDFDKIIGLSKLNLIHLNDSKEPLKSKKDRHANIGTGHIWGKDTKSLVYLLEKCKSLNIPMVLETCCGDMITISKLK